MSMRPAFYLLRIVNEVSVLGRIMTSSIANMNGPVNMLIPVTLITGILTLCIYSANGLIVFAALCGFSSGGACVPAVRSADKLDA